MTPASLIRVLVVEDEPVVAQVHAEYVRRTDGYTPAGIAHTAAEALRFLQAPDADVDLVLLDMNLPDLHGLDLLRRIRGAGIPADVIAVTAVRESAGCSPGNVCGDRPVPDQTVHLRGVQHQARGLPRVPREPGCTGFLSDPVRGGPSAGRPPSGRSGSPAQGTFPGNTRRRIRGPQAGRGADVRLGSLCRPVNVTDYRAPVPRAPRGPAGGPADPAVRFSRTARARVRLAPLIRVPSGERAVTALLSALSSRKWPLGDGVRMRRDRDAAAGSGHRALNGLRSWRAR